MMARMARSPPLSASVTGSKARAPRLVHHFDALAEIGTDHRARGIGQAIGKGDQFFVDAHMVFQKDTINPPAMINIPPARIGSVGSSRKNMKLMICHMTNKVAI